MEGLLSTIYSSVVDHVGWIGAITPELSDFAALLEESGDLARSRQGTSGPIREHLPTSGGIPFDPNFTLRPHAEIESGVTQPFAERGNGGRTPRETLCFPSMVKSNSADASRTATELRRIAVRE
ncbi:hypothetical protein AB0M45_02725 [Nocardia sp. NPDC051787]|uniref:hypothetical protein n=1 Tax=Nocardia sp. NPDC051787 TaxID=3155415 RepID=UPI00343EBADB